MIIPFHAIFLFLYPLKTSENQTFSEVFRGYGNETLVWNKLVSWICTTCTDKTPSSSPAYLFAITGRRRLIKPLATRLIKTWDSEIWRWNLLLSLQNHFPQAIFKRSCTGKFRKIHRKTCGGVLFWRKVHIADSKEQLFYRSLVTSYALSLI